MTVYFHIKVNVPAQVVTIAVEANPSTDDECLALIAAVRLDRIRLRVPVEGYPDAIHSSPISIIAVYSASPLESEG